MKTFTNHRLAVLAVVGFGASLGPIATSASTPPTEPPVPPIAVEELTRIDEDTLVRGNVTDDVTASFTISHEGMEPIVIDLASLSNVAVARFTVQPGAQFPWHTHPGPVIVTVTQGELVYVMADGCSEHSYASRHRLRRSRPRHGAFGLQPDRRRDDHRRHVHRGPCRRTALDHRGDHRPRRQLRPADHSPQLTDRRATDGCFHDGTVMRTPIGHTTRSTNSPLAGALRISLRRAVGEVLLLD